MSRGNHQDLAFAVKAHMKNMLRLHGRKPSRQCRKNLRFGAKIQIANIKMEPNMFKKLLLNTVVTQYFILISLTMQLQKIVQIHFTHQRRIIDAILAI